MQNCDSEIDNFCISKTMFKKITKTLGRVPDHQAYVYFKKMQFFKEDLEHLCNIYSESAKFNQKHDYKKIADELIRKAVIPTSPKLEDIKWDEIQEQSSVYD